MTGARKRQSIILGVMALVVLYGLYDLIIASKVRLEAPDANIRAVELQSFITQTTATIGNDMPSAYDMYIASRAGSMWGNNPFYRKSWDDQSSRPKDNVSMRSLFVFEGYIETGGRKVAVINDVEYMAGDPLEKEGFFVKKISPSSVLIENRKEKREFKIPLSE
jgi:hypothetical protein